MNCFEVESHYYICIYICINTYILNLCFCPWTLLLEHWIGPVTMELICVKFIFSTRIFYRGETGFPTCPCGVWCCRLTLCLLYVSPIFGNIFFKDSWFTRFTLWRCCFFVLFNFVYIYIYIQNISIYEYFISYCFNSLLIEYMSLPTPLHSIFHRRSFDDIHYITAWALYQWIWFIYYNGLHKTLLFRQYVTLVIM